MSKDYSHYAREQLSQATQEQAVLAQEESIHASTDFISNMTEIANMPAKTKEEVDEIADGILSLGEVDSFYCDDTEYAIHYLDGVIPVYVPIEEDDEIECDEHVIEAIIEREEHELLDDIEGDKQAIDYFSEEHIDEFGEKCKKRLEEMKGGLA